jgi:hypothetical protein
MIWTTTELDDGSRVFWRRLYIYVHISCIPQSTKEYTAHSMGNKGEKEKSTSITDTGMQRHSY